MCVRKTNRPIVLHNVPSRAAPRGQSKSAVLIYFSFAARPKAADGKAPKVFGGQDVAVPVPGSEQPLQHQECSRAKPHGVFIGQRWPP